jgi:hypothetical protein
MPITINGSGTVTGLTPGGLPDGVITNPDLAADAVSRSKLDADTATGVCKAWVNFNGTGTVAIRASYNVSSITDNGTGDYTVNFTTAMPDANYTAVAHVNALSSANRTGRINPYGNGSETALSSTYSTTAVQFRGYAEDNTARDSFLVNVAIFR